MLPVRFINGCTADFFPASARSLAGWARDLDHLFGWAGSAEATDGFRTDIRRDGDDLVVEADVPGLTKDDIDITVEDGVLAIAAEHKSDASEEKGQYHLRERRYGKIARSFRLPSTSDGEKVTAELANGVLTLRIPTREEAKPCRIEVN